MAELLTTSTVALAAQSAELSTKLYLVQEACGHEATSADISAIASELALLSSTLWRLYEAVVVDPNQYTESFNQDLAEITKELEMIFDETNECCTQLQKADQSEGSVVAWMFKKGRVYRLQKHLEALKTTLIVMRTVLWHGKDYGTHNSPGRLAESQPHTMHEDRVILESVFAKNRNAIVDLHNLDDADHQHTPASGNESAKIVASHYRSISDSTGVEVPPISDVLPAGTLEKTKEAQGPTRRFSKRGVRLGVHKSILDLRAQQAPDVLKNKWLQQTRANTDHRSHIRKQSVSEALSKISEVDSMSQHTMLKHSMNESEENILPEKEPGPAALVHEAPTEEISMSKTSVTTSPVTRGLRKAMKKLSISHTDKLSSGWRDGKKDFLGVSTTKPSLRTPNYDQEFENGL